MAWLKRLFGKTERSEEHENTQGQEEDVASKLAGMTFPDLLEYCQSFSEMPFNIGLSLTRRLFDIAYHDRATEPRFRQMALEMVESLIKDLEASITDNPQLLQAYREAYTASRRNGELHGYGTLFYELQQTPGDKVFTVMVARRNSPLVSRFVELADARKVWEPHKCEILRALIQDRAVRARSNIVFVLFWLLHTRDQAAWHYLTEDERAKLLNADVDYMKAREVLVGYGLLPTQPTSMPYVPVPEPEAMCTYLTYLAKEKEPGEGITDSEVEAYKANHGERFVCCAQMMLIALRLTLAFNILRGIYGEAIGQQFKTRFFDTLATSREGMSALADLFMKARELSCDPANAEDGFDCGVTAIESRDLFESDDDEENQTKKLNDLITLIRRELAVFPGYWRFLLRAMIHTDKLKECMLEDALIA